MVHKYVQDVRVGPKQILRQGTGAQVVYLEGDAESRSVRQGWRDRETGKADKRAMMSPWGFVRWGSPSELWRRRLRTVPLEDRAAVTSIY